MSARPVNLLVFREGRREISACELKDRLVDHLRRLRQVPSQDEVLKVLLLAGELECAAVDAGAPQNTIQNLEKLTDAAANLLLSETGVPLSALADSLQRAELPERLSISNPEGFAYYALHPLAYAEIVESLAALSNTVVVMGIRTIGLTLSAVVAAALRRQGKKADRISVRPQGHPYNRELHWTDQELALLRDSIRNGADFLVVDEGPGLSGSSFLAVAEALLTAGVSREKITLMCSHYPDVERLCANNASQRARQFRWVAVNSAPRLPQSTGEFVGGGEWRRILMKNEAEWPAVWTSFERLKYRSSDLTGDPRLYKFLGFGHYGEAVLKRERQVAAAGFGPEPRLEGHGFASYRWLQGRPMTRADLNEEALRRLAEYCAFRASAFPPQLANVDALQQMADHNLRELGFNFSVNLQLKRPVIADGHMQPHEWLLDQNGTMLKTDSGSHGDDHFFPGPTDVAWDLAGAIVEWEMSGAQTGTFLDQYRRVSGDNARPRIPDFVTAYAIFRTAYCQMAANAMGESEEGRRFLVAAERYKFAIKVPSSTASRAIA